ncbi:MAG: Gfo/Idh/MocA family oxidoreductase [Cellvibrio sp.]|nr:Gfo/Idh/MocA family oxidoreductase [Cellvibrio sp.]
MTKKIRWGIISTANIGVAKVIPALQKSKHNQVVAIASRDIHPAMEWAQKLSIPKAYGSYDELFADAEIDAIYNPLPNHLHIPYSVAAVNAGKHVLCEKPLGLDLADTAPLIAAAEKNPQIKIMEAFMYRFHPQWQHAKQMVEAGAIGKLRNIQAHFFYNNRDDSNIRNKADWGGGALLDIGCYPISVSRLLYGREPKKVFAQITPWPGYEVDCLVNGTMDFGDGLASFAVSTKVEPGQLVIASGEAGGMQFDMPFSPEPTETQQILLKQNRQLQLLDIAAADQYAEMGDAFALSILNNTAVPTPLTDGLANMRIIDAMFESAKKQEWVNI